MYVPKYFAQTDIGTMHALMREHPLATLVVSGPDGLDAHHVPLQLAPEPAPYGTLRGHIARANPLCRLSAEAVEALAVFRGPESYVSPSWYASKAETGRVVPTWNYAAVHAYGGLRLIDDPQWTRRQVESLTAEHEGALPRPWSVDDAPADYIGKLLGAVVGIEIVVSRLLGKWKTSQNQPAANRASLAAALDARGEEEAACMAELVRQHHGQ